MDYFWVIWGIGALALLAVEAHTQQFYALFVAVAALAAAVVDLLNLSLWWQGLAFLLVGFAGLFIVRRFVIRHWGHSITRLVLPGVNNGFVGQHAITVDAVGDEHHPGHALMAGQTWLAISVDSGALPPETPVVITDVRGTTLLVRREQA